ncbi:MAG TPA: tetratricopeptide repeat protein [Verrucomicrobiota bacterium]|nr:tetratricopeptide repeat protein [Verrucomicrobiota bacterium]
MIKIRLNIGIENWMELVKVALLKSKLLSTIILLVILSAFRLNAATVAEQFEQANKLYEMGRYDESASVYEGIINSGHQSVAIYFNWGNALFKSGKIGKAIYAYLQAERIAPRDPDVKANLQFARKAVSGGVVVTKKKWIDYLNKFTLNEWTICTAFMLWCFLIMLAICQWKTEFKNKMQFPIRISLILLIFFGFGLGLSAYNRVKTRTAVVIVQEGNAHQGPFDESPKKFALNDGLEFDILDTKGEWLQVVDSSNRIGWVKTNQVIILPTW